MKLKAYTVYVATLELSRLPRRLAFVRVFESKGVHPKPPSKCAFHTFHVAAPPPHQDMLT